VTVPKQGYCVQEPLEQEIVSLPSPSTLTEYALEPLGHRYADGIEVGTTDGLAVGDEVGVRVGAKVGDEDGFTVGVAVGVTVGVLEGTVVGLTEGVTVGVAVRVTVGVAVGATVGVNVGVTVEVDVGIAVGATKVHTWNALPSFVSIKHGSPLLTKYSTPSWPKKLQSELETLPSLSVPSLSAP
jgi:hypothetical protein